MSNLFLLILSAHILLLCIQEKKNEVPSRYNELNNFPIIFYSVKLHDFAAQRPLRHNTNLGTSVYSRYVHK